MFGKNKISAVILAGGTGTRMAEHMPKQYLEIGGKPILSYSVDAFENAEDINEIILVVPQGQVEYCEQTIARPADYTKITKIIEGGQTRQESSYKGVISTSPKNDFVMIHDGARPFVQRQEIRDLAEKLAENDAVIMAVAVKDTIKKVSGVSIIEKSLERNCLWAALTPQAFRRELIIDAHEQALKAGYQATDDAALLESMGYKVRVTEGDYMNIKITTKEDMVFAEAILAYRRNLN